MDTASGAPQAYPSTPGLSHLTTQAEGQTISYTLRIRSCTWPLRVNISDSSVDRPKVKTVYKERLS